MRKKIILGICFLLLPLLSLPKTLAVDSDPQVLMLFDKQNYVQGDLVELTVNINNYHDLFEVKLRIYYPTDLLLPVLTGESYFDVGRHLVAPDFESPLTSLQEVQCPRTMWFWTWNCGSRNLRARCARKISLLGICWRLYTTTRNGFVQGV
jgi:hypothetical protein